jgi:hypothetical protein
MAQRETRRWQKFLVMNFQLGKGWNSLATYHAKFTRRVSKAQRRLAPASSLPCVRSKWNAKLRCAETTRKRAMVKEHRLNAVPDTVVHGSCAVFAQASFRAGEFSRRRVFAQGVRAGRSRRAFAFRNDESNAGSDLPSTRRTNWNAYHNSAVWEFERLFS